MTNFGKGKIFGGEKKIDTFRSPTRELILDACHLVDKTRKAAGQLNNHTFPFSSRLHLIFFYRSICSVKFVHENHSKQFVQSVFYHLMNSLLKTFWWKILENHFKNIHRATLYVNKRAILLILDRTSRKSFRTKDLFELKKSTAQNWEFFFLESKIRYRTRDRPGGLRFSIISFNELKTDEQ